MTKSKTLLITLILLIATLPQITTDLYTPSLPAIAHSFAAHVNKAQFSLAIFVLAQSLTQLFYGPLSEGIGRRKTLLIGLVLGIVGGFLCWFANSIDMFIFGRFVQGCGMGAATVVFRAVFRDSFEGTELAKMGSILGNFCVLAIVAAPFIGGLIQEFSGWRAVFAILTVYVCLVSFIVMSKLKETSQHHHTDRLKPAFIAKTYVEMLSHRVFTGYSLCVFLTYAGLFAWLTSGPIVLIKLVGIRPAEFGTFSIFMGAAIFLSSTLNAKLVKKLGMAFMLRFGLGTMLFAGVLMLVLKVFLPIGLLVVLIPALIFVFGSTFVFPNCFAAAFSPFGHVAGYAGALYGCIQVLGGAVSGMILSHIAEHSQVPLAIMLIISAASAYAALRFGEGGTKKSGA